jgi:hypothetical protein
MNSKINNNTNGIAAETNLESLIRKLKDEDTTQAKMIRRIYIMYITIIVLFSGMYILNPDPDLGFYQRLTGAVFLIGFTMMTFAIRKSLRLLRQVDYTQSVYQVFIKAAERYRFWETKRMVFTIIFILIIDISISMVFNGRYLPDTLTWIEKTLIVQAFYIPLMAASFTFGWMQWRKTKKPILGKIEELLLELEEGKT